MATAYATLGEAGLTHSLNEPDCAAMFTNADLLKTVVAVLPNTPTVKHVLYDGKPSPKVLEELKTARPDITVITLDELLQKGEGIEKSGEMEEELKTRRPTPETLACIMYTSGSVGAPKGVLITHSMLVASLGSVYVLLGHHLTGQDTYMAYLPLAHVMEYIVELSMLFAGVTVGFGTVKTLTDASVRNCKGDMVELKPSIMVGVPAVWEMIRKGVLAKINAGGTVKKAAFNGSMKMKKGNVPVLGSLLDSLVLSQVRAATGGKLRVGLCGGAAISKDTQEFMNVAIFNLLSGSSSGPLLRLLLTAFQAMV